MATQLKHTDFASFDRAARPVPLPASEFFNSLAPRPNIRVAFIAGEAATAVHDAMAKLPADTRDGTLEDLVWDQGVAASTDVELIQSMTCSLIDTARDLLSPRMYSAFLKWGEAAAHLSSFYESDEEGGVRCSASGAALREVAAIPAENAHDMMFRAMLTGMEAGDCSSFGPFEVETSEQVYPLEVLSKSLGTDLSSLSPIADGFEQLSKRAWALSNSKSAFSVPVGNAITSAFSFARGEDCVECETPAASTDLPAGYDRYMGGPLIAWCKAYASYEDARDALHAYDRDVHTPTFANLDIVDDIADQVQEQYDTLLMAEHDAIKRLYRIPAPSASELAVKLKIFEGEEGWNLTYAPEAIRRIAIDARRWGRHGAHLQTDAALIAAFSDRRHEFEATDGVDLSGDQEDAYFARVDAAEMVVLDTRATTLEGAIAKLRVAFMNKDAADWSDLAISNTADPKFVEGLRMSGMYERMAWGAIEDLARIAGVSLAEQGA